ncbi:hypothetical protein [Herbaspirillum robiniae]|uniref:hypothetical protein n=1 Tax=Herbaspirillum robiniae TaxID=2014887 RepID=UPI003D77709C
MTKNSKARQWGFATHCSIFGHFWRAKIWGESHALKGVFFGADVSAVWLCTAAVQ